jgi:hypothetical protein
MSMAKATSCFLSKIEFSRNNNFLSFLCRTTRKALLLQPVLEEEGGYVRTGRVALPWQGNGRISRMNEARQGLFEEK